MSVYTEDEALTDHHYFAKGSCHFQHREGSSSSYAVFGDRGEGRGRGASSDSILR